MPPEFTGKVGVCKSSDGAGFGWNILLGSGRAAKKRKATGREGEEAKKMKVVRFDDDDSEGGTAEGRGMEYGF